MTTPESPTVLPRRRFLIQAAATAGLAAHGPVIANLWAAESHRSDWFHEAGWGVITHYLGAPPSSTGGAELSAEAWNEQVDAFDLAGLVRQLASTRTKYLLFTVGQIPEPLLAQLRAIGRARGTLGGALPAAP